MSKPNIDPQSLYICWTTVPRQEEASKLARLAVEKGLAACVQQDAPIRSTYSWEGKIQEDGEIRLSFKAMGANLPELKKLILDAHPYDTPQWIVVKAENVSEKYLKWAKEASNLRRLI